MADARAWMPLYVGSYIKNTMRLTTVEHGAYFLLMLEYWNTQQPIPDDDRILSSITKTTDKQWKTLRNNLAGYFRVSDGLWRHDRIEQEIAKAKAIVARARENGSKGGRPKTHEKPDRLSVGVPTKNTSTSTFKRKKYKKEMVGASVDFVPPETLEPVLPKQSDLAARALKLLAAIGKQTYISFVQPDPRAEPRLQIVEGKTVIGPLPKVAADKLDLQKGGALNEAFGAGNWKILIAEKKAA